MKKTYIPFCMGEYDAKDNTCSGTPGKTGEEGEPCSWREKCLAFARHLRRTKAKTETYLIRHEDSIPPCSESKTEYDKFIKFCDVLVTKLQPGAIRMDPNYDKRRDGPTKYAKRAAKKAHKKKWRQQKERLSELFSLFLKHFKNGLKDRSFALQGKIVVPGELYISDRTEISNYVVVNCRTEEKHDMPIIRLKYKLTSLTFDVYLPVDLEYLENNIGILSKRKLKPKPINDASRYKVVVKNADKFELGIIAEFLADVVNDNILNLPSVDK